MSVMQDSVDAVSCDVPVRIVLSETSVNGIAEKPWAILKTY